MLSYQAMRCQSIVQRQICSTEGLQSRCEVGALSSLSTVRPKSHASSLQRGGSGRSEIYPRYIWLSLENLTIVGHSVSRSLLSESVSATPRLRVKIRSLSQRSNSITCSASGIVVGSAVPIASIIPDSEIVLVPFEPHLSIMVVHNKIKEVFQQHVTLIPRHTIDSSGEALVDENALPACDRVRADDRMDSSQRVSVI